MQATKTMDLTDLVAGRMPAVGELQCDASTLAFLQSILDQSDH